MHTKYKLRLRNNTPLAIHTGKIYVVHYSCKCYRASLIADEKEQTINDVNSLNYNL